MSDGAIDFSKYTPEKLIGKAALYARVLGYYMNKTPCQDYLDDKYPLYGGGYAEYKGYADFSNPEFRDLIEKGVLPRARDMYDEATKRGMGQAVRSLWGPALTGFVIRQNPAFVEEHFAQRSNGFAPNVFKFG